MSFSFAAAGSKFQVLGSLRGLTPLQLGTDNLGASIRDLIMAMIDSSADPAARGQRYNVSAYGDSGPASPITMAVRVEVLPDASLPERGTATETLGIA